jgi:hypothetical protein
MLMTSKHIEKFFWFATIFRLRQPATFVGRVRLGSRDR